MDSITRSETAFAQDVREGLTVSPKFISSKYFYDKRGSELFRKIMRMPSYYPTDLEFEIFQSQKEEILTHFAAGTEAFQMIEFGAGDGLKTKVLLSHFLKEQVQFSYSPIDISESAIVQLEKELQQEFPSLMLESFIGDYFQALFEFSRRSTRRKAVLFLGSNIGNFTESQAIHFLNSLGAELNQGDKVLIGFDLKKDPNIVMAAYNDPEGITREFNLNLLRRMNNELGADFDLSAFMHAPSYDPLTGETKSYIVSKKAQKVYFKKLDLEVEFFAWEAIWTELSQKYDYAMIGHLAKKSGFEIEAHLTDQKGWYVDSIWRKL